MKEKEFWESYKELSAQLASELPELVVPFGELFVIWSPFIMLVFLFFKMIDLLFKSASIKFLANGFVYLCKFTWNEAYKEPEHKGLIIEASIKVQRAFHKTCAWLQGVCGFIMIIYAIFIILFLMFFYFKGGFAFEDGLILIILSAAGIFVGLLQIGLCHQSIKLAKSLPRN
ncbi:hypothetical protein ABFY09_09675 [Marinomonas sp. 5E14-1]|uniref:hypothetical protein n=1 Tax=Marinomonas sp. 5E14-1 TaxID=3153922 RepID=UPI0032679224